MDFIFSDFGVCDETRCPQGIAHWELSARAEIEHDKKYKSKVDRARH